MTRQQYDLLLDELCVDGKALERTPPRVSFLACLRNARMIVVSRAAQQCDAAGNLYAILSPIAIYRA